MQTICKTKDYLVVYKPHDLPTVPLKTSPESQDTLLKQVSLEYPEVLTVHGDNLWEGSAVHRLDTATAGLVLFALTQEFYDYITAIQKSDGFEKVYLADVSSLGNSKLPTSVSTYFRAYGVGRKIVKPETDVKKADSSILYKTDIKTISESKVQCTIRRGFRHQIRSHLAYCGFPIVGDALYKGAKDSYLHLECVSISFVYQGKSVIVGL